MGRYFRIEVGQGNPGAVPAQVAAKVATGGAAPSNASGLTVFTNQLTNGLQDMRGPQVELDIPVSTFATPAGMAHVKVWGVSLQQIQQASDFNGAPIKIFGGMQKGLPLATAAAPQSGLLLAGCVLSCYGNWMGINQTLDFIITTDGGATQAQPTNLTWNWKKGTPLGDAVKQTLATAYPGYKISVKIKPNLVLSGDEPGVFSTIQQFAAYLKAMSANLLGGGYPGVDMSIKADGSITVYDGSSPSAPVMLAFQDLIGQPTWLSPFTLAFATVMRGDLAPGDVVKFPELAAFQTTTTPQSFSFARDKSTFQGSWTIGPLARHVGASRAPDAMSWISNFQAYSSLVTPAAQGVNVPPTGGP